MCIIILTVNNIFLILNLNTYFSVQSHSSLSYRYVPLSKVLQAVEGALSLLELSLLQDEQSPLSSCLQGRGASSPNAADIIAVLWAVALHFCYNKRMGCFFLSWRSLLLISSSGGWGVAEEELKSKFLFCCPTLLWYRSVCLVHSFQILSSVLFLRAVEFGQVFSVWFCPGLLPNSAPTCQPVWSRFDE